MELVHIVVNLQFLKTTYLGMKAPIDRGASHNFTSLEGWESFPKETMVPTNVIVKAINGAQMKPIGHATLDVKIEKHMLQVWFYVTITRTMEECMVLGQIGCY